MLFVGLYLISSLCKACAKIIFNQRVLNILFNNNIFKIIRKIMSSFLQTSGNITSKIIKFKSGDKTQCYDITHNNTVVYGSSGNPDHGSSQVKLKNIVDYKWEVKDYPGHLVAVHLDGVHIAYSIAKANATSSGIEGMVRVANTYTGQRALIKGMSGEVLDLQFAHLESEHILGCIDERSLHIHKIDMLTDKLICNLLIRIEDPIENFTPKFNKISWCPYVHSSSNSDNDDADDDIVDVSQLIVWSRGGTFQCFNIKSIINANGLGKHDPHTLTNGYLKLENSNINITWVSLSPDGSTLGVGSDDGYIRFYQMYFHEKEPRCLHEWIPHNSKVISSFFFLDNLNEPLAENYWKFALTGAEGNTEIKLWDCGSWTCLQTILFAEKNTSFIAEIDSTASYLVLTNRETRNLYVLQILKQTENELSDDNDEIDEEVEREITDNSNQNHSNAIENDNDNHNLIKSISARKPDKTWSNVVIKSITEFPLSSSVLSFCIIDASIRKYKCGLTENYLVDEIDDYDEENNSIYCIVVRLLIVQPKSLQECHVLYQPSLSEQCSLKNPMLNENFEDYSTDTSASSAKLNQTSSISSTSSLGTTLSATSPEEKNTVNGKSPKSSVIGSLLLENKEIEKNKNSTSSLPLPPAPPSSSSSSQLNLMGPELFTASGNVSNDKKPTDCVSSEVLSTILMLASVTGSSNSTNKAENIQLLNLVNNKVIEDQEKRKMKLHQKNFPQNPQQSSHSRMQPDVLASGNSSPSREVQEIMSLSCENYYDENDTPQHVVTEKMMTIDTGGDENPKKSNTKTDWPKVPDIRNVTKHSTEIANSSNVISSTSLEINDLSLKINQLIDVIQMQSLQINALKDELVEIKNNTKTDQNRLTKSTSSSDLNVGEMIHKLEKQIPKILEQYLIRFEENYKQKLDAVISAKDTQNREMRNDILHYFNEFMSEQFIEKITTVLITEIQRNVVPVIVDKLDVIKQQIQGEVAQKLTTTDKVLRDNIAQVCRSKSIIDAFGNSVLLGVKSGLQSTYIESMSTTLIPAYEKSSQEMFKQLHDTFSVGIKEVMKQFDSYLLKIQTGETANSEILKKLIELKKQMEQNNTKNVRNISDITIEFKKDMKAVESNIIKHLSQLIQNEIRTNFESQAASLEDSVLSVVRSQAHTPAPLVYDMQDQIKYLLSQGQINKAFHQALIANDLSLVEYALEKADYKSVFNPCALEQTVLLSLIQQISADMNNHNDVKQRYLSDAILNLDLKNPVIQEHAPKILRDLYKNCQTFLTNHPNSPLYTNLRMIMMAIQGMGYNKSF